MTERYEKALSLVTGVPDYDSFRNADLVIVAKLYPYSCTDDNCILVSSVILIFMLPIIAGGY
jgi:hypothetical protein